MRIQNTIYDGKPSADIFFFAFRFCACEAAEAAEQAQNRKSKEKFRGITIRAVHAIVRVVRIIVRAVQAIVRVVHSIIAQTTI